MRETTDNLYISKGIGITVQGESGVTVECNLDGMQPLMVYEFSSEEIKHITIPTGTTVSITANGAGYAVTGATK